MPAAVDPRDNQHLAVVLYDQLRALARARMNGQRGAHTLDPTGLANEAVLRLLKCDASQIRGEQHFLAMAAEAMRQILVDHARAKRTQKRGEGAQMVSLSDAAHFAAAEVRLRSDPDEILALHEALTSLEADDAEAATIVKMRAFVGMSCDEISALTGLSKRTIERRWRYSVAELRSRLGSEPRATVADREPTGTDGDENVTGQAR